MAEAPALKFPLGADNRAREYALPEGALRERINLDATAGGGLVVRPGLRRVTTTTSGAIDLGRTDIDHSALMAVKSL